MNSISRVQRHKYSMVVSRVLFPLIALSLFFLTLNGLPNRRLLGELSVEGAVYPMLLAIIIYGLAVIQKGRINKPNLLSYQLLTLFLVWVLISGILNFHGILANFTKGRSGVEKFSLQFVLLLFVFFTSMVSYATLKPFHRKNILLIFRRWILFSFLFAGIYSLVIEIPAELGQGWAISILGFITPIIHGSEGLYLSRLRSLSGEASWFGMYLGFVFPWLMSYYFTERKTYKYIYLALIVYALILAFLTYSRTAYFIIASQIFAFVLIIFFKGIHRHRRQLLWLLLIAIPLSGLLIIETNAVDKIVQIYYSSLFEQDREFQLSNIARIGSQLAAIHMGLSHPLAGVGLGQYGFYMPDYLPTWALDSPEINLWASSSPDTSWAPVQGLWVRILAETGFVGIFLWLSVWISVLISVWKRYRKLRQIDQQNSILPLSLLISILGLMLIGLVSDSLRSLSYWITLGVTWAWLTQRTDKVEQRDES